jgi:transposase-like protein
MGTKDKERRVYSKEFKAEAVALAQKHEKPIRQVAADSFRAMADFFRGAPAL